MDFKLRMKSNKELSDREKNLWGKLLIDSLTLAMMKKVLMEHLSCVN